MKYLLHIRGLTMVEAIIVVALFSLIMLVATQSISSFYRFNAYAIAQSYQVSNARRGVDVLIRDVREMTYADDGSYPLVRNEPHLIGFYSDIDRDDSVEYVEYEVSGSALEKRVYDASGDPPIYDDTPEETLTLSEYVQNINQGTDTFTYYDTDGVPLTASSTILDVRYIDARVIVNIDPVRDPGEFMLRSSAALRNLKDNL